MPFIFRQPARPARRSRRRPSRRAVWSSAEERFTERRMAGVPNARRDASSPTPGIATRHAAPPRHEAQHALRLLIRRNGDKWQALSRYMREENRKVRCSRKNGRIMPQGSEQSALPSSFFLLPFLLPLMPPRAVSRLARCLNAHKEPSRSAHAFSGAGRRLQAAAAVRASRLFCARGTDKGAL